MSRAGRRWLWGEVMIVTRARTPGVPRRPASWWAVVGVIGALISLSAALARLLPDTDPTTSGWHSAATFVLLTVMFGLAEVYVLHVQVKREAQTVALSEIPLVLGLTFVSPTLLVGALVLGATTAYVVHRRQRGIKLAYNIALKTADALVSVTLYQLVLGDEPILGWRWIVACYLAVAVAALLDGLTTQLVIGLHELSLTRSILADVAVYPAIALAVSTVALVVAYAYDRSPLSAVPAVAAGVCLVVGYQAYSRLSDRHLSLERLYRFSQAVTSTPEINETLGQVLTQAKELLRSEHAEISFFSGQDSSVVRIALSPSGRLLRENVLVDPAEPGSPAGADELEPLMMPRGTRVPAHRSYLSLRRWREAIVVPLRGDAGIVGTLSVADRMGDVRSFDNGDMRLLETVAAHAGMALQNSRLIDQLRHESLHDALTGLPNRVLLRNDTVDELLAIGREQSRGCAVMIMDLDGFKEVNDTLGHQHGDELLKAVASRTVDAAGPRVDRRPPRWRRVRVDGARLPGCLGGPGHRRSRARGTATADDPGRHPGAGRRLDRRCARSVPRRRRDRAAPVRRRGHVRGEERRWWRQGLRVRQRHVEPRPPGHDHGAARRPGHGRAGDPRPAESEPHRRNDRSRRGARPVGPPEARRPFPGRVHPPRRAVRPHPPAHRARPSDWPCTAAPSGETSARRSASP